MSEKLSFLTMFSALRPDAALAGELADVRVVSAAIDAKARTLTALLECPRSLEALLPRLERELAAAYGLSGARLTLQAQEPAPLPVWEDAPPPPPEEDVPPVWETEPPPPPEPPEAPPQEDVFARTEAIRAQAMKEARQTKGSAPTSGTKTIYGKISKTKLTPIPEIELDMGSIVVEGQVTAVNHREMKKRQAWVISFDVTDFHSSVRVSRFLPGDTGLPLVDRVKPGMRVRVQGTPSFNQFEGEVVLEPTGVMELPPLPPKEDSAPQKRVELHLHTRMSAMDALTDPKAVVKRAESWGHPAIAITDHGVLQSFPDAWHAAKDIKILYGVEAYFQNDVDEKVAVHRCRDPYPLDGEFVAFDLETTGLNKEGDRIIEIGAAVLRGGALTDERFQTFVDPGRMIPPKITTLTSITDDMVRGAPSPTEAVKQLLEFAAGRPLVAHNAAFDTAFLSAQCRRDGVEFTNPWVDTLLLGQYLLPDLKDHKLDTIAAHLHLPGFHHHRADDDAATCALALGGMLPALAQLGVTSLEQINPVFATRKRGGKGRRTPYHLIILVKNKAGLRNLYKLVSLSHLDYFSRNPIMPKSVIEENREGLIFGSACEAGELFRAMVDGADDQELERIASWYDYLEIQPISNNAFMLRADKEGRSTAKNEEQLRDWNRRIVALGARLGKPVCATGDVHFMDPEDEIFRHVLLASKGFEDADSPNPLYFRTTDEMLEEFSYLGAETAQQVVVTNTNLVADWCDPIEPLPHGLFTPKLENSDGELRDLVWGKAHALYGEQPPQIVVDRINAELTDIINCKYDVIYMSAQKLVQDSLAHGYLVGSRGSVGSSLVAFMSGITEVNSLPAHYRCPNCKHSDFDYAADPAHPYGCGADMPDAVCPVCGAKYEKDGFHIPFETFLGFGGDKVPDIDLNFSGEYQANAHRYTFELFGKNHVFRAGTIGTVAEKTAYGYVKKYCEERGITITKAEETRLALGCTGVKRTTGQHPGGMVVIPQDKEIYDFCPVQHPADDKDSDIITTHFEYHSMESNLLKLDMLGHDDPSMIRMLQDLTGVDPQKIPLDDPDTMSLFTSSKALGYENDPVLGPTGAVAIPEFNTRFTRGMLEETQPHQFDILLRLSGFSHGTDVWLGNARDLILQQGVAVGDAIGCRDDIMLYLISKGFEPKRAFKIMEAVRKGRGLPEGAEQEMVEHDVPDWYIGSCKKIKYLFPKAHAVAYVMMAFRIAWFKVHRPIAFYAAFFSIRAKAFDATVMCQGMERCKAKMKEIQAKSQFKEKEKRPTAVEEDMLVTLEVVYEFYLRGFTFERMDIFRSQATRFVPDMEKNTLLPPFTAIPGLGESAALDLENARKRDDFVSIEEIAAACPKASKTHIEQLKEMGAFGTLPDTSQISLF
jgi:DNA polymerase-3 subunit alpha (Gram-positive type)